MEAIEQQARIGSMLAGTRDVLRAPPAYPRCFAITRADKTSRAVAFLLAGACLSLLCLAAWLKPDIAGTGTHEQLGLAPCQFKLRTGLPCPCCGMTTSFTYFAHGHFVASFYVQPMGFTLALLATAVAWIGMYTAITGRPVYRLLLFLPGRYYFTPLLVWGLAAWIWKIFLTLHGIDGWR